MGEPALPLTSHLSLSPSEREGRLKERMWMREPALPLTSHLSERERGGGLKECIWMGGLLSLSH
jgi:hypothetical protein